jgi:hypothetical protein
LRRRWRRHLSPAVSGRGWLKGYARLCFVAALIVFALSPTTLMMWQVLILLQAAILPVILWAGSLERTRIASRVARGVRIYAVAEVVLLIAIAFGNPQYRCGGRTERTDFGFPLRSDHPMLRELNIQQTCPWPVNQPEGWWPDVLPESE